MELDELKRTWQQYDKKLSDNLKVNEALIKKMNLNSSKRELQKPLIYELFGVVVMFIVILLSVKASLQLIDELKFSIPGIIAALMSVVYFISAVVKANRFMNVNYYNSSIVQLQKEIASLNKLVLKLRKVELILIPFLIIPMLILAFKAVHNIDIYNNVKLLIIEVVLAFGIATPLVLWINKHLYDKKFKIAENLLQELEKFEKE